MAETLKEKLLKKGWPIEEVERTLHIMQSDDKKEKHVEYRTSMNFVVYWTVLLVLTLANFMVSIVLVPFLLILKPFLVEIMVAMLGLVFGLLFNLVIRDIENIETKHHLAAAVFIPAIAVINIFVMISIANRIAGLIRLIMHQNPIFVSLIYVAMFLLPYSMSSLKDFLRKKKGAAAVS